MPVKGKTSSVGANCVRPSPSKFKQEDTPMKYVCPCGYEYDPAIGDPDNGIAPGTPWEDIPEDWTCPTCGLGKDAFEQED